MHGFFYIYQIFRYPPKIGRFQCKISCFVFIMIKMIYTNHKYDCMRIKFSTPNNAYLHSSIEQNKNNTKTQFHVYNGNCVLEIPNRHKWFLPFEKCKMFPSCRFIFVRHVYYLFCLFFRSSHKMEKKTEGKKERRMQWIRMYCRVRFSMLVHFIWHCWQCCSESFHCLSSVGID